MPLLLFLAQAAAIVSAPPVTAPIAGAPVGDPVLADQRGGFQLPNGVDVALTIQTQTALNGAVLLRTVFQVDRGAPTLAIYAPKPGETVAAEPGRAGTASSQASAGPIITYDRTSGLQITQSMPRPTSSVSMGGSAAPIPDGLTQVATGAVTDAGVVGAATSDGVRSVSLTGTDLTVTHLVGNAFGSAIANSGSDRTIDTQTTLSISLGNAGPDTVGSALFRVQDLALDNVVLRPN